MTLDNADMPEGHDELAAIAIAFRIIHFKRALTHAMADEDWALDLAEQLLAYDPLAAEYAGIHFEPNDRIVVEYRCAGRSTARRTFVVPRWVSPEKR